MVSRATEWRERAREAAIAAAVQLQLPSGATILARRPDPLQLAAWGALPLTLVQAAGESKADDGISNEQVREIAAMYRDVLLYCCVDPAVSLTPGPDEMHPRDIPEEDWRFITSWAMRVEEARDLQGFRRQRGDAGGSGDGESLLRKTI